MALSSDVRPQIKGCPSIATSKIMRLNIIKYIIICKYLYYKVSGRNPNLNQRRNFCSKMANILRILPSSEKNSQKNLNFYCFFTFLRLFTSVPDQHPHLDPDPYVFGPPRSASGSVRQRYGSEDLNLHPDPYQNGTHPQHCLIHWPLKKILPKCHSFRT
jgi:hypothetical protein